MQGWLGMQGVPSKMMNSYKGALGKIKVMVPRSSALYRNPERERERSEFRLCGNIE